MKCPKIRKELVAYLDGEASARQTETIEAHLAICKSCRKELSALKGCLVLLRKAPQIAASENFYKRLRKKIDGHRIPSRRRLSPQLFYLVSLAASLLIIVFIGFLLFSKNPSSTKNGGTSGVGTGNPTESASTSAFLKSMGVNPKEEKAIVANLHILKAYPLLQKLDVIENMDILKNPTVEDYLPNDF